MIIKYRDLEKYQKKVVMVDGCFDPLHPGHIRYFSAAGKLGFPLLCCVENDKNLILSKKRPPLLSQSKRAKVIDVIRFISFTVCSKTETVDVLKRLRPVMYVKGGDWAKKGLPDEEKAVSAEFGIKVIYLNTVLDSSSQIIKRFNRRVVQMKNKQSA